MKVDVNKTRVNLEDGYVINRGEFKINPLEFQFSSEYNGLVKKALFVKGNTKIEQAIIDNTCNIPYEVLNEKDFELRVYAYEIQEDELILRYSPTFAKVVTREGSYLDGATEGQEVTPTEFEQYMQAMESKLQEAQAIDDDIAQRAENFVQKTDFVYDDNTETLMIEI